MTSPTSRKRPMRSSSIPVSGPSESSTAATLFVSTSCHAGLIRSRSPRHCSRRPVRISDAHAAVARHAHKPGQGESLADSSARGNKVKLGDAIREVAGRRLIFPDYILPPRKYFAGPREQWTEMLLCIGRGRFQIQEGGVKIGDTTFLALGAEASFQIFEPGQNLGSHPSAIWWHSAPEVGASSTGNAGLELTESSTLTPNPTATTFTFSGNNIIIPSGAGSFPSDWVAGTILRVEAQYPYTVVDGGGSARDTISAISRSLAWLSGLRFRSSALTRGSTS